MPFGTHQKGRTWRSTSGGRANSLLHGSGWTSHLLIFFCSFLLFGNYWVMQWNLNLFAGYPLDTVINISHRLWRFTYCWNQALACVAVGLPEDICSRVPPDLAFWSAYCFGLFRVAFVYICIPFGLFRLWNVCKFIMLWPAFTGGAGTAPSLRRFASHGQAYRVTSEGVNFWTSLTDDFSFNQLVVDYWIRCLCVGFLFFPGFFI